LLEPGAEALVVRPRTRIDPRRVRTRSRARDLRRQLRRNTRGLLEIASRDADQTRLVGLTVEALLVRAKLVEQIADLVRDEPLVREASDRRELVRAHLGAVRRHHRLLVPAQQRARLDEIVDVAELGAERLEAGGRNGHSAGDRTCFGRISSSSSRRPSSPSRRTYMTSRISATRTSWVRPVSRWIVSTPRCTLRSSCCETSSCTSVTSAAPATAPLTVPMPPTISITITAKVGAR